MRSTGPSSDEESAREPVARSRGCPGGDATVDEMSEWSFPASDPPATWTWEIPDAETGRARDDGKGSPAGT
jgi:hypothetical protein